MSTISTRQYQTLSLVKGDTDYAKRENDKRNRRGKFRRIPVGRISAPERSLNALERRGLVAKDDTGPDLDPGQFLWTLTSEGEEALRVWLAR